MAAKSSAKRILAVSRTWAAHRAEVEQAEEAAYEAWLAEQRAIKAARAEQRATATGARRPRRMPQQSVIARYWHGRMPDSLPEVDELLAGRSPLRHCWACGTTPQTGRALDRAHLLGRWAGGTDTASNLVLLCRVCHRQQPDQDRDVALAWVRARARARHTVTVEASRGSSV